MNILRYYLASIFLISTEAYCGSIGWQNIPSPDYSSSNALLMHSSDQFNSSMNNLSNSISDMIEARERKKAQQEELDRQEAYNNQLRAQNNAMQEELARRTAYENELKERKRLEGGAAPYTTTNTFNTTVANTANLATAPEYDKLAYISVYETYKADGAAQAIAPMKKFIADYPESPFVPNAYYWLGEFNLAITPPNFKAASKNFELVMNKYPRTAKAAAATYRLASLADADHHKSTAIMLMQSLVKNYPGTQEAGFAADYLK